MESAQTNALIASLSVHLVSLIGAACLLFGHDLTPDQLKAVGAIVAALTGIGGVIYVLSHNKGVAHTQQLADTLTDNNIPIPPPANKDVEYPTTATKINTTIGIPEGYSIAQGATKTSVSISPTKDQT